MIYEMIMNTIKMPRISTIFTGKNILLIFIMLIILLTITIRYDSNRGYDGNGSLTIYLISYFIAGVIMTIIITYLSQGFFKTENYNYIVKHKAEINKIKNFDIEVLEDANELSYNERVDYIANYIKKRLNNEKEDAKCKNNSHKDDLGKK